MTDDQFLAAFENCRIRGEHFHHADHVRMGFLYLCRFPTPEALRRFCDGLMNFAAANGKPALYHETITWAFLLLIRERVARWYQQNGRQPSWDEFAGDNSDLLNWKNNILRKYYRDETLASEFAKRTFVFPDRIGPPAIESDSLRPATQAGQQKAQASSSELPPDSAPRLSKSPDFERQRSSGG